MSVEVLAPELPELRTSRDLVLEGLQNSANVIAVQRGHEGREVNLGETPAFGSAENTGLGVAQDLDAVINAGGEMFGVVKVQDTKNGDTRYMLTRFAVGDDKKSRAQAIGLLGEEPLAVGRASLLKQGHKDLDSRMSRNHFSASMKDGKLKVTADEPSSNETQIMVPGPLAQEQVALKGIKRLTNLFRRGATTESSAWSAEEFNVWSVASTDAKRYLEQTDTNAARQPAEWEYTRRARDRSEDLKYAGRDILRRDSKVDGSIMVHFDRLGLPLDEAAEIDFKASPVYNKLLDEIKIRASNGSTERMTNKSVVDATYAVVHEAMRYSLEDIKKVVAANSSVGLEPVVPLSSFIQAGVGVCRHQGVVAALMLEKLVNQGWVRGKVSFDANVNWNATGDELIGGHAWARFESEDDEIYVIDVAQGFHDKLANAGADRWNYMRPDDEVTAR